MGHGVGQLVSKRITSLGYSLYQLFIYYILVIYTITITSWLYPQLFTS